MELFEVLFILLFVLFPIIEQVLKKRRKEGGVEPGQRPGQPGHPPSGEVEDPEIAAEGRRPAGNERERAADMVPDDLWAVLTGERPPSTPGEVEAPWSGEAEESPAYAEPPEPAWEERPEPVSLEYEGPEAYTLETMPPPPESLETPVPTAEARHEAFHALIDRPRQRTPARRSTLGRALQDADSLRKAVLLREVLGPPKGLE